MARWYPSAAEIDRFLHGYGFDDNILVEQIEVTQNETFQFFMFAALDKRTQEVRIIVMWPDPGQVIAAYDDMT
jgi:hypothetical protein